MNNKKILLLSGSSSTLAQALAEEYKHDGWAVIKLGRNANADLLTHLTQPESVDIIKNYFQDIGLPDLVINCIGILHDEKHMPEKKLSDLELNWLKKSIDINVISHIHLAQALEPLMTKNKHITWVSLSAMLGSIQDNGLGAWYSYRMTKAALNMFLKTLSIEWARKHKLNKVFAMHPGTTDSQMTKPFKIRKDRLYKANVSAQRVKSVLDEADQYKSGSFINWNGEEIPW